MAFSYSNNNLSKAVYCSDLLETSESARFVQWNGDTLNTPFKAGLTDCQEGFAFCYGNWNDHMTVIAFAKNSNKMWGWSKVSGNWVEYATKNDLSNYLTKNDTVIASQSFAVGLTTFEVTDKVPVVPNGYERIVSILYTTQNYLFAQLAFVANDKVFLTVNNCHPSLSINSEIRCVQLYKRKI